MAATGRRIGARWVRALRRKARQLGWLRARSCCSTVGVAICAGCGPSVGNCRSFPESVWWARTSSVVRHRPIRTHRSRQPAARVKLAFPRSPAFAWVRPDIGQLNVRRPGRFRTGWSSGHVVDTPFVREPTHDVVERAERAFLVVRARGVVGVFHSSEVQYLYRRRPVHLPTLRRAASRDVLLVSRYRVADGHAQGLGAGTDGVSERPPLRPLTWL